MVGYMRSWSLFCKRGRKTVGLKNYTLLPRKSESFNRGKIMCTKWFFPVCDPQQQSNLQVPYHLAFKGIGLSESLDCQIIFRQVHGDIKIYHIHQKW